MTATFNLSFGSNFHSNSASNTPSTQPKPEGEPERSMFSFGGAAVEPQQPAMDKLSPFPFAAATDKFSSKPPLFAPAVTAASTSTAITSASTMTASTSTATTSSTVPVPPASSARSTESTESVPTSKTFGTVTAEAVTKPATPDTATPLTPSLSQDSSAKDAAMPENLLERPGLADGTDEKLVDVKEYELDEKSTYGLKDEPVENVTESVTDESTADTNVEVIELPVTNIELANDLIKRLIYDNRNLSADTEVLKKMVEEGDKARVTNETLTAQIQVVTERLYGLETAFGLIDADSPVEARTVTINECPHLVGTVQNDLAFIDSEIIVVYSFKRQVDTIDKTQVHSPTVRIKCTTDEAARCIYYYLKWRSEYSALEIDCSVL
ncbi:hypothetical protein V1512DRAFT_290737 [Lipomyces arxii]|uniref:uncharacterized protein n=1 Tax=Lipomyces arxii TaxID=56418 RepID=UPI0034D005DE